MGDRLLLDPQLAPALHAAGVRNADALFALAGPLEVPSVVTTLDLPVPGTVGRFHLKRYTYEGWGRAKGLLGRGTLWGAAPEVNEFRVLVALRGHEVPAVRPVAAAARTKGGRLVAHALLTEHVPGALDLQQRLQDPADPVRQSRALRRRVSELIGRCLQRMHSFGFVHRDVHARNILVRLEDEGPRIWFCDCRRGGPPSWRSGSWHDLAMLDADWKGRWPRSDRLAALQAYLSDEEGAGPVVERIARLRGSMKVRAWS